MSCQSPDPANTVTDRLNQLLSNGGDGYVLSLCPGRQYTLTQPLAFAARNQEISTQGYPTGDERATLVVAGPVADGKGHTTAVDGTCNNCDGVKLRNIQVRPFRVESCVLRLLRPASQINGTRNGHSPTQGGANIEMGGDNSGQLVRYFRNTAIRVIKRDCH